MRAGPAEDRSAGKITRVMLRTSSDEKTRKARNNGNSNSEAEEAKAKTFDDGMEKKKSQKVGCEAGRERGTGEFLW